MRLIDADALIKTLGIGDLPIRLTYEINNSPTVDAVPVIRCKYCKNFVDEEDQCYCIDMAGQCDGNGFCAWAERKEE